MEITLKPVTFCSSSSAYWYARSQAFIYLCQVRRTPYGHRLHSMIENYNIFIIHPRRRQSCYVEDLKGELQRWAIDYVHIKLQPHCSSNLGSISLWHQEIFTLSHSIPSPWSDRRPAYDIWSWARCGLKNAPCTWHFRFSYKRCSCKQDKCDLSRPSYECTYAVSTNAHRQFHWVCFGSFTSRIPDTQA